MPDDLRDFIYARIEKSHEMLIKFVETMCIISAGTIAAIVSLKSGSNTGVLDKWALMLFCVNIICTLVWFLGKGNQFMDAANKAKNNPNSEIRVDEPWYAKIARVIGFIGFVMAYILLVYQWWV